MTVDPWAVPSPRVPLHARLTIPGSKSLSARHLIIAALASRPSRLSGLLRARDTELMIAALRAMGTRIDGDGHEVTVTPGPITEASIDVGLAGTVFRFLTALSLTSGAPLHFHGDPAMSKRPITPLIDALASLGVNASSSRLPLTVQGPARGRTVTVDASQSSQFVSALLLAGPLSPHGLEIHHDGERLPSLPHIDMTVEALRHAGATITSPNPHTWIVEPGPLDPGDVRIEPDLSNASVFLAAPAIAGGSVTVTDWPTRTTQAGNAILDILTSMGARVTREGNDVTVTGNELTGIDIDLGDVGELTPTVAALCACASGPSRLTGIAHLRGHETDRLAALSTEITKLGGDCQQTDDGLVITPRPLSPGVVCAYDDHRMATFGTLLGLATPGMSIDNIGATSKTLPTFTSLWQEMMA